MGERKKDALRVDIGGRNRLGFHGADVTCDDSFLACREHDASLGLTKDVEELEIDDRRTDQNTCHNLTEMLRHSYGSRLDCYEDTNGADRLTVRPAMRRIIVGGGAERTVDSTSQVGRIETEVLASLDNLT